ncbi:hypothetical protein FRC19_000758 [Serendipita sp. 401]|nr:hypothetical protein FRC19_000758 [Serendipita sp. 401]KAG9058158.1 hypothetical protein FS842_000912 [Serendipita sp. 407]
MMHVRQALFGVGLVAGLAMVGAQQATTTAVCGNQFNWMQNDRSQSPCLVAAYLQGACGIGEWTVPLLPIINGQQQAYNPPNNATSNLCTCSGAVYNLMSACAACQGGGWILFAPWSLECDAGNFITLPDSFPANIPIPSNTTIPKYATIDPRSWTGGRFNVSEAQAIASGNTNPSAASSISVSSTSTAASNSNISTSTETHKVDNTGAIVGGVVGGLLGIALIGVLLLWILRGESFRNRDASKRAQGKGSQPRPDILGRAFSTPNNQELLHYSSQHANQHPPSIIAPIPVRPYPLATALQSYQSASTTGSAKMDEGTSSRPDLSSRSPRTSIGGMTLLQRVASGIRWRSHSKTNSATSHGSGTVMTSNVTALSRIEAGDEEDERHGMREISRQNSTRRMVEPTPYIVPLQDVESRVLDISSGPTRGQPGGTQEPNYGFPSASEEKRRLNPPADMNNIIPPSAAPWLSSRSVTRFTTQEPNSTPTNSLFDLASGAATAGSNSHDGHSIRNLAAHQSTASTAVNQRPLSDQTRSHSLPSNIVLNSPLDGDSQAASSGVLDVSPILSRPSANGQSSNMRFMLNNPDHEIEM